MKTNMFPPTCSEELEHQVTSFTNVIWDYKPITKKKPYGRPKSFTTQKSYDRVNEKWMKS